MSVHVFFLVTKGSKHYKIVYLLFLLSYLLNRLFPVEVRNNHTCGQIEFLGVSTCHVRHVLHISIELSSSCQKSTISYSVYGFL